MTTTPTQLAAAKRYRENNRETIRAKQRESIDPVKNNERVKDYYKKNRETRLAKAADYRAANKALLREKNSIRNYGISDEQRNAMLIKQHGRCAICMTDKPVGKGGWHLDHCHNTGRPRGLLCHHCNVGLGHFKDNPTLLHIAAIYLETR